MSPFVQPKPVLSPLLKSVPPQERTALALDALDGFVLSMAEQAVTLNELLELVPLPRGEGVRRVEKLLSLGALRVQADEPHSARQRTARRPLESTIEPEAPKVTRAPASFPPERTSQTALPAPSPFPPERTTQTTPVGSALPASERTAQISRQASNFPPERSAQVSIIPAGPRPNAPSMPAPPPASAPPTFQERTTITTALPATLRAANSNSTAPRTPSSAPSASEERASVPPAARNLTALLSTPAPNQPPADGLPPLLALSRSLAQGPGVQRWASGRLIAAHEEEQAGHYVDALNIVRIVLAQFDDERVRAQQERLRKEMLRAQASRNRSRAVSAGKNRDWASAAKHWQDVLEGCPDDREATFMVASCLFEAGDAKAAGRFAKRAVELAPDRFEPRELLVRIFEAMGMELNAKRERAALDQLKAGKKS